ncbi:golgi matrix protein [Sesbania bispinosa]|nr:golgi matrix protein [Sesbania bispinosa]
MASAAMRALRAAQVQGGVNREPEIDTNLSDEEPGQDDSTRVPSPQDGNREEEEERPIEEPIRDSEPKRRRKHKSKSPKKKKKRRGGSARVVTDDEGPADESAEDEGPDRDTDGGGEDEDGEPVLYDEDSDIDHPALMSILGNEEVVKMHSSDVRNTNEALEEEVNGLKASVELVGKELKSYKTSNKQLRTMKEKAEKSLAVAKAVLKKAREDMALRTAEVEAAKKEVLDLRAEKEQLEKAGGSATGMNKQVVTALVRKNLSRHRAKWDGERAKLVAIGNNLVKDSFENAMAQLSLRNPSLVRDGVSHEFEVFRGQVCKVDTVARKLVNVDSGVELATRRASIGPRRNERFLVFVSKLNC